MEELLRQAFQLGQQWVQDMNNDKEPTNFNEWYASGEVQEQVKNCSIPAVMPSCEGNCGMNYCDDNGCIEQTEPCTIHGVVCCAECDAMIDEQRWHHE